MIRFKFAFAIAAIVALCAVAPTQAANMLLTVDYAGSFDSSFTPLPGSPPAPLNSQNAPHAGAPAAVHVPGAYHAFDVFMTITGLPAGEDFQTVQWDMVLGPGVTPSDFGYVAADPAYQYDPPGPPGLAALFSQNGDAGSNTGDLQRITVITSATNSHQGTHLRHPGENEPSSDPDPDNANLAPPTKLGTAYVFWDGTFGGDGKSFVGVAPNGANPWTSITANNTPVGHGVEEFTSGAREEWVQGGVVDDFIVNNLDLVSGRLPGSTITAGPLSTNDADDPDNGIAWLLESLTGPGGAVVGATVNPTTGVFTWNSPTSAAKGAYTAVIRGTNDDTPAGTDTGNLTFDIVPEPATMSLLGLAMLGIVGVTRRR
jgi:hypothetical protein